MLRQVLTLLLIVTLLALAWAGLKPLGWLQPQDTSAPEQVQAQRQQVQGAPHKDEQHDPLPVKPASPLSPPAAPPREPQSGEPVPSLPATRAPEPGEPAPPVPQATVPDDPAPVDPTGDAAVSPAAPPTPEARKLGGAPPAPEAPPAQAPSAQAPSPSTQAAATPLTALNAVRALAGLPAVQPQPQWQAECDAHATYLTVTDTGSHSEDPASPHYSAAGARCAPGHYYVTMRPGATAQQAVTYWQNGPFHLPQLLDPRLTHAALAVRHDAAGDLRTAAVLDVKRGRHGPAKYPVRFPHPERTVTPQALSQFEFPDALPGCPGYTHPAGAPLALLLGPGGLTRGVRLTVNGEPADVCLLTAQTFNGSTPTETRVGRTVLAAQGVAVAVPRHPLPGAARVKVSFQTDAGPVSWFFRTR